MKDIVIIDKKSSVQIVTNQKKTEQSNRYDKNMASQIKQQNRSTTAKKNSWEGQHKRAKPWLNYWNVELIRRSKQVDWKQNKMIVKSFCLGSFATFQIIGILIWYPFLCPHHATGPNPPHQHFLFRHDPCVQAVRCSCSAHHIWIVQIYFLSFCHLRSS